MATGRVDALAYRSRIVSQFESLLHGQDVTKILDVGAGDGWIANQISKRLPKTQVTAIDVQIREHTWRPVKKYDGDRIPFEDSSFDLVYASDVLHHAHDPARLLSDMMRCTSRFLLLKDHTYSTPLGWLTLGLLDELGNRRLGIPSRYHYQHRFTWADHIETSGFKRVSLVHPAEVEDRIWGRWTNKLQFVGLWCRT